MTQESIASEDLTREVRLYVFGRAALTGRVPQPSEIVAALGCPQTEVEQALRDLAAGRVLILAPNDGNIWQQIRSVRCPRLSGLRLAEIPIGASAFGTRSALWQHSARTP